MASVAIVDARLLFHSVEGAKRLMRQFAPAFQHGRKFLYCCFQFLGVLGKITGRPSKFAILVKHCVREGDRCHRSSWTHFETFQDLPELDGCTSSSAMPTMTAGFPTPSL
jgi:hypothetical protein